MKEYKKLKKDELVRIIQTHFATYGRLRMLYANLSLEREYLLRRINMLEGRLKTIQEGSWKRTFKNIDNKKIKKGSLRK